jgi:hypothetical protein
MTLNASNLMKNMPLVFRLEFVVSKVVILLQLSSSLKQASIMSLVRPSGLYAKVQLSRVSCELQLGF